MGQALPAAPISGPTITWEESGGPAMTVAFDAAVTANQGTGDFSYTHTPVGTPRGVIVLVSQHDIVGDVTAVTYGGVSMTEVSGSPAIRDAGEDGQVHIFFLGSSIPTGAQTVAITTSGTYARHAASITLTAGADTEVVDTTAATGSAQSPTATLSLGGRDSFCAEVWWDAGVAISNKDPLTDWSVIDEEQFASLTSGGTYRYNTIGSADVTFGYTSGGSQPYAMLGIAVSEVEAGGDMSASGSLSIAGSADLDGTGSLGAAGSLSIVGAADLDGPGSLTAYGTLSVAGAAVLNAIGSLAATGALSIVGSASPSAIGQLLAGGALSISGAATLSGLAQDMTGSGALSIVGAATLNALGLMSAAGTIDINGVALLTDPNANDLEASGLLVIAGTADLDALGAMQSAGALTIVGSADLAAIGQLLASGQVSVTGMAVLNAVGQLVASGAISIVGGATLIDGNAIASQVRSDRLYVVAPRTTKLTVAGKNRTFTLH